MGRTGVGAEQAEVSETVAGPTKQLHYRPHLDGLRTIAVYLVVAFHSRLGVFTGGYVGVDIFYVLSGFLVTSILLRDLASVGHVDYRRFYSRRVRRILPAAFVTLLVTAIAFAAIATPAEMLDALGGFRAAFLYVANWFFIRQATDYFAADVNASPVLHFWSLAIEEQFYLLWPLLLTGLYALARQTGRRPWWVVRTVVAVAAIASVIAAVHIGSTNLVRAYYGTDTRAYQLLVGALLALTPQLLRLGASTRRLLQRCVPFALGALLALGTSIIDIGPIARGALVAVLVPTLIAALENARGGTTKRMLSSAPFTYLGRVSYGTYLWHWPIIVLAAHERHIAPVPLFLLACGGATTLAALSYHLLEHRVRSSRLLDRYKGPVVALGFAASIIAGLVVMPVLLDTGRGTVSASGPSGRSGLRLLDWRVARNDIPTLPDCLGASTQRCTVVRGTGTRILLMGDSNARMWIPTFADISKKEGFTFSVASYPVCPWQKDLTYLFSKDATRACKEHQADWYRRVIPELDPDVIFLAHQAYDDPARPVAMTPRDGRVVWPTDPRFSSMLVDYSSSSLRALARPGRKLVIIEPIPITRGGAGGFNPLDCVSTGTPSECAYQATEQATPLERYYRQARTEDNVFSLDLDRLVCPSWPRCDEVVGNIIVKRDVSHLTATYARSLSEPVDELLRKTGILGGR